MLVAVICDGVDRRGGMQVHRVDMQFGGLVSATWGTLASVLETYRAIAAEYSLLMPRNAFTPVFEYDPDNLIGLQIRWVKEGLLESSIQAFNETWFAIAKQYSIARFDTVIRYYIGE